ncbi:MAG: hypothetical protein JXB07_05215 [Anaerolineae bacterium]|nr:hypothetical protein [Anaerolineae bacterium]
MRENSIDLGARLDNRWAGQHRPDNSSFGMTVKVPTPAQGSIADATHKEFLFDDVGSPTAVASTEDVDGCEGGRMLKVDLSEGGSQFGQYHDPAACQARCKIELIYLLNLLPQEP